MRRAMLLAIAGSLSAWVAGAQEPTRGDEARAVLGAPVPGLAQAPEAVRSEDVDQLKAAVSQLQDRLNQLAPPAPPVSLPTCPGDASSLLMKAEWKNGLQISSPEENFRFHVGGTLQFDSGWNGADHAVQFGPGGTGELQDGAVFRRARIRFDGTMYEHIDWVAEFDFANNVDNDTGTSTQPIGSPSFTNVWIGMNDLPLLGTVRVGWIKEPIGFEHLESSRWLNFMERSPGADSLDLRSPGILLLNSSADQRVTWALGVFHAQNDNFGFGIGDGQYAETGRVTWLPIFEDDGRELLHLGIGASHRHLSDNQIDIRGRPSVRTMPGTLEPALAETGTIVGTSSEVFDVELAGVCGPWTLQSEYYGTFIHNVLYPDQPPPTGMPRGTLFYQGAYVELLYFLTGEYRAYDRKTAVFDRVVPLRNFNVWSDPLSWGAWQVGIRYAYLDLQDKGVNGATLNDLVLGLNWFLTPNSKVQWNVALDHREATPTGSNGWTYIFGSRVALDF